MLSGPRVSVGISQNGASTSTADPADPSHHPAVDPLPGQNLLRPTSFRIEARYCPALSIIG